MATVIGVAAKRSLVTARSALSLFGCPPSLAPRFFGAQIFGAQIFLPPMIFQADRRPFSGVVRTSRKRDRKGRRGSCKGSHKGLQMPNYTFALRDGADPIEDDAGVTLMDRQDAYRYAQGVVRELMRGREAQTRTWRLDVYENSAECVFAITFASLDRTLESLEPELRALVETLCERDRAFRQDTTKFLMEARARLARSRGEPYLITHLGRRVIPHR
jgi:hypothetical protein